MAQQTAADLTAAQLLQRFVRESTGATLPLLHDVTPRKGDILIGASDTAGLAEDGFRLRTQDGVLRISSGGDKGAVLRRHDAAGTLLGAGLLRRRGL